MEPFTRKTAFLAFLENTLCRKVRSSARLELDDETVENEILKTHAKNGETDFCDG